MKRNQNNKKTRKINNYVKKYCKIDNRTLFICLDGQKKYYKRGLLNSKIINNILKIDRFFRKNKLPTAYTRYAHCNPISRCTGNTKSPISKIISLSKVIDDIDFGSELKKTNNINGKDWQLADNFDYVKEKEIFNYNIWNPFNNKRFLNFIKKKRINKMVITGGFYSFCVLSVAMMCINHDILPIIIKDACFGHQEYKKSSYKVFNHCSVLTNTRNIIQNNKTRKMIN